MIKGTLDFDYMDHLSFPLLPHILDTKFKDSLATLEVKITDKSGKIRTITKTPFEKGWKTFPPRTLTLLDLQMNYYA